MKKFIPILIVVFLSTVSLTHASVFDWINNLFSPSIGAPALRYERTILPETTSTYNLGSLANKWLNVYTNFASTTAISGTTVCIGSDCQTSWPAGEGTVTSVAMTVPTGLTISGSPITTSGTLALTLTAGYVIPLSASTTNWNTFYNTPSSRITAGTNLSWSNNTLNASGGGITSLEGQTGATQTFATSSDTNIGLTITSSGDVHTFTSQWFGTLDDGRIGSAAGWNAKQAGDAALTSLSGLTVGAGGLIVGTGADAFTMLAVGNNSEILSISGGTPYWVATTTIPLVGDVTGTLSATVVGDDSHAHTSTTLSGIDISADTNLTAGVGLTLTGDDVFCDTASGSVFGCLTSANWTTFNNKVDTTVATLSSLASIGTITTGTWNGTSILPAYGGTGLGAGGLKATFIPYGNGTSAFATSSVLYFSGGSLYSTTFVGALTGTASGNLTSGSIDTYSELNTMVADVTLTHNGLIDTFAELDAIVADKALVNKADGAVWLGVHDFGGATSLEIPNAAAPTVDALGEMAFDTTTGQLKIYNGSAVQVYKPERFVVFGYATSTSWTSTTTLLLAPAMLGETWNTIRCETNTGSVGVSVYDGTNRLNYFTASTTIGLITFSTNNSFTSGESRRVDFGTPATSPKSISCKAAYFITAD